MKLAANQPGGDAQTQALEAEAAGLCADRDAGRAAPGDTE